MKYRIIQLTDLHIGDENHLQFGVNPRSQFLSALKAAVDLKPDLLILTGDLSLDKPDQAVNTWVKQQLDSQATPYRVIAGNHDLSRDIANTFHAEKLKLRELYYEERFNEEDILFLDTSLGRCSTAQWAWFEERLKEERKRLIIFAHHPLIFAGMAFMDNRHPFMEQDRFDAIVENANYPIHLFCGHFHNLREVSKNNVHMHMTPSTLFQMDPNGHEFKVESTNAGFRIIDLYEDFISSTVNWVTD